MISNPKSCIIDCLLNVDFHSTVLRFSKITICCSSGATPSIHSSFFDTFFLFLGWQLFRIIWFGLNMSKWFKFYIFFYLIEIAVHWKNYFEKAAVDFLTLFQWLQNFCFSHFKSSTNAQFFRNYSFSKPSKRTCLAKKQIWFLFIEVLSFHLLHICLVHY